MKGVNLLNWLVKVIVAIIMSKAILWSNDELRFVLFSPSFNKLLLVNGFMCYLLISVTNRLTELLYYYDLQAKQKHQFWRPLVMWPTLIMIPMSLFVRHLHMETIYYSSFLVQLFQCASIINIYRYYELKRIDKAPS